ncbi:uncharacterized protein [Battus philenor]|uniref:uncharacterized protein n=1 Tax=Battus philenor TaxID=42288 RepID=UPI0035D04DC9
MQALRHALLPLCVAAWLLRPAPAHQTFRYEQSHNYGRSRRAMTAPLSEFPGDGGYPHPQPLRVPAPPYVRPPYRAIQQGVRRADDRRVYSKKFHYVPKLLGHSVFCQAMVTCKISHVSAEAAGGTPVLLGGGAGYRHLRLLVKAAPGVALRGALRAYCRAPAPAQ